MQEALTRRATIQTLAAFFDKTLTTAQPLRRGVEGCRFPESPVRPAADARTGRNPTPSARRLIPTGGRPTALFSFLTLATIAKTRFDAENHAASANAARDSSPGGRRLRPSRRVSVRALFGVLLASPVLVVTLPAPRRLRWLVQWHPA